MKERELSVVSNTREVRVVPPGLEPEGVEVLDFVEGLAVTVEWLLRGTTVDPSPVVIATPGLGDGRLGGPPPFPRGPFLSPRDLLVWSAFPGGRSRAAGLLAAARRVADTKEGVARLVERVGLLRTGADARRSVRVVTCGCLDCPAYASTKELLNRLLADVKGALGGPMGPVQVVPGPRSEAAKGGIARLGRRVQAQTSASRVDDELAGIADGFLADGDHASAAMFLVAIWAREPHRFVRGSRLASMADEVSWCAMGGPWAAREDIVDAGALDEGSDAGLGPELHRILRLGVDWAALADDPVGWLQSGDRERLAADIRVARGRTAPGPQAPLRGVALWFHDVLAPVALAEPLPEPVPTKTANLGDAILLYQRGVAALIQGGAVDFTEGGGGPIAGGGSETAGGRRRVAGWLHSAQRSFSDLGVHQALALASLWLAVAYEFEGGRADPDGAGAGETETCAAQLATAGDVLRLLGEHGLADGVDYHARLMRAFGHDGRDLILRREALWNAVRLAPRPQAGRGWVPTARRPMALSFPPAAVDGAGLFPAVRPMPAHWAGPDARVDGPRPPAPPPSACRLRAFRDAEVGGGLDGTPGPPASCDGSVFFNVPYDADYRPRLLLLMLLVRWVGYRPVLGRDLVRAATRVDRIAALIGGAAFSVHDFVLCRGDGPRGFARMNMAFEAGMAWGRPALILVPAGPPVERFASDLADSRLWYRACRNRRQAVSAVADFLSVRFGTSSFPSFEALEQAARVFAWPESDTDTARRDQLLATAICAALGAP